MHREDPRLTRDQLVTIITDFYIFLTKFYVPTSALKFPPEDGWPNITPETTKHSNKSPIVINLIKHLPYIEDDHRGTSGFIRYIHHKCEVVDYSKYPPGHFREEHLNFGEDFLADWVEEMEREQAEVDDAEDEDEEPEDDDGDEIELDEHDSDALSEHTHDSGVSDMSQEASNWWDGDDPDEIILSNMIVLAIGHESGGRNLVLDVFKGNIHEDIIRCTSLGAEPIEDFFTDLRGRFEKLELVPTPEELGEGSEDGVEGYRRIYRECGWPGEGFRKDEALVKIREWREREMVREDEEEKLREEERARQRAMVAKV